MGRSPVYGLKSGAPNTPLVQTLALVLVLDLCLGHVAASGPKATTPSTGSDDSDEQQVEIHPMADLETGRPPYAACYGNLTEHAVEINGIRKVVLVNGASSNAPPQDAYAEWLKRWRHRHQGDASSCTSEDCVDENAALVADESTDDLSQYVDDELVGSSR
ncbi:hypothetical protein FE257_008923 [Aspergillus nanangensis]|uniref:Secreted protein n=1 Tax=Aspergillus nanangensis TaxID=2582783 RepID=A0AAD4GYG0_ASPNN|nr:hypothetical protein FE257_008923 [Aspergillus nanangensis]